MILTEVERWREFCDEKFLVHVLEGIDDAVLVVDVEGKIVYINQAYERVLNVKAIDMLGINIQDIAPESVILRCLRSKKPILRQPSRVIRADIDIIASATPIYKKRKMIGAAVVFKNVSEIKAMHEQLERLKYYADYLKERIDKNEEKGFELIIGENRVFKNILRQCAKAAKSNVTILLTGETGTGKDLIARAIHDNSKRADGPYVEINCAAIPANLLESELFGYEEGAFTGARKGGKPGLLEIAHGGTAFLDEIGEMSIALQSKLLRVLQEKSFEHIGGTKTIRVDIRLISATNVELESRMQENAFRPDLYYRLCVFRINLIPLRSRRDDIPLLVDYFMKKYTLSEGKVILLSPNVMQAFLNYGWPGNVRELQNVIESAIVSSNGECIEMDDIPEYIRMALNKQRMSSVIHEYDLNEGICQHEKNQIRKALDAANNNKTKAIRMLNISRSTFYKKLMKYGLDKELIHK